MARAESATAHTRVPRPRGTRSNRIEPKLRAWHHARRGTRQAPPARVCARWRARMACPSVFACLCSCAGRGCARARFACSRGWTTTPDRAARAEQPGRRGKKADAQKTEEGRRLPEQGGEPRGRTERDSRSEALAGLGKHTIEHSTTKVTPPEHILRPASPPCIPQWCPWVSLPLHQAPQSAPLQHYTSTWRHADGSSASPRGRRDARHVWHDPRARGTCGAPATRSHWRRRRPDAVRRRQAWGPARPRRHGSLRCPPARPWRQRRQRRRVAGNGRDLAGWPERRQYSSRRDARRPRRQRRCHRTWRITAG